MKCTDWDSRAEDVRAIVLIHTAVNERTWKEIKQWVADRNQWNPCWVVIAPASSGVKGVRIIVLGARA